MMTTKKENGVGAKCAVIKRFLRPTKIVQENNPNSAINYLIC